MEESKRKKKTLDIEVQRVDLIFLITQLRDSINATCLENSPIHKRKMDRLMRVSRKYLSRIITDAIRNSPRKHSQPGG